MANFNTFPGGLTLIGAGGISSGSRANTSLNAAFVNATSGAAVAIRYMAMTADPIDEFYIFLDDVGGTIGSITMAAEIFNEQAGQPTRAGTTSRDTSTTITFPAAVDRWIKFTFGTPYTPTVGEILWFVASNTSGAPATDFPIILTATTGQVNNVFGTANVVCGFSTTTGFTTNGTSITELPFVIKQGSRYFGQPFTQIATVYTSNTRKRGMEFTPPSDVTIYGMSYGSSTTQVTGFEIFDGSTDPGGTPLYTFDMDGDPNQTTNDLCGSKIFSSVITLSGGAKYRAVVTFAAASTVPTVMQIEDYSTYQSMFDAMRDELPFAPWSVIDDGASGWTTEKNYAPTMALLINTYPASAPATPATLLGQACL